MYCQQCGKQISDDARFCNHCGKPVNNAGGQTTQQTAAPKKRKTGGIFWVLLACAVVFLGVKHFVEESSADRNSGSADNHASVETTDSSGSQGLESFLTNDSEIEDAVSSCARGSIYENGYLRFAITRVYAPSYTLLPGEGEERDWMLSPDGTCLLAAYRQLEILDVSYEASTEANMLDSYRKTYSDASIVDFQKIYVDGFPVIRYIVRYTAEGVDQYQGELIVCPRETTNQTVRVTMFVAVEHETGLSEINRVFDTLQVSTEYQVTENDTNVIDFEGITVK